MKISFAGALSVIAMLSLSSCAFQAGSGSVGQQPAESAGDTAAMMRSLDSKLEPVIAASRSNSSELSQLKDSLNRNNSEIQSLRKDFAEMQESFAAMNKNVKHLAKTGASGSASGKSPKEVSETNDNLPKQQLRQSDGKLVLGEYEWVKFPEQDLAAQARIDTGASISSISAISIEKFEREGKTWYRFQFPCDGHKLLPMEAPFVRTIRTRQASAEDIEVRPVVRLEIQIGDVTTVSEFSLKDRTKMDFPVLIGRTFLIDNAVVDVSKRSIQRRPKAENVGSSRKVEAVSEDRDEDVSSSKNPAKKSQSKPQLKNRPSK